VFPFTLLYIRANGQRQSRAPGFSFVVRYRTTNVKALQHFLRNRQLWCSN